MNKKNQFRIFLEKQHPLHDEVHFSQRYDMAIYEGTHFFDDQKKLKISYPFSNPEKLTTYYEKCIRHIKQNEPKKIREFLFYDLTYEQAMIMAYRPDTLRKGKWCFSIVTILPFQMRMVLSSKYPDMKREDLLKRLVNASQQPIEALEYVLSLFDLDKLEEAYNNVNDHIWDTYVLSCDYLKVIIENNRVKSIFSHRTFRSLRLIEV